MEPLLVQQLIERCCTNIDLKEIIPNEEGWGYFVAEVNDEYIFRFPRFVEAEKDLEIEIAILPKLGPRLSLPIPNFEYICKGSSDYPWKFVGYLKIHGVPMKKHMLNRSTSKQAAEDLGVFLTHLHNFPLAEARRARVPFYDTKHWHFHYASFYNQIKADIFSNINSDVQVQLKELFQEFLGTEQHFQFGPVVIHRDLGEEHILWNEQEKRITGIIDWNDITIGDPAFDFSGLLSCYGEPFTKQVIQSYERVLDNTAFDRIQFYAKISWCHNILYAQKIQNQKLLHESIHQLQNAVFKQSEKEERKKTC